MTIILEELTIAEMQSRMAAGELTAVELTGGYLARMEAIDRSGPTLNAVIELNPDALDIAARLDEERAAGQVRGPLHGIPILLKDNIETGDGLATSAGSLALADHRPAQDSTVAANLRRAGALILGKTNLSEWANFRSSKSSSGWSSRGGQTRNPYALDRTPCGSSSGSGVAVAANLCAAAIGTETDGSIVCPSHHNGIVGIKPTVGLVSRAGIVPIRIARIRPDPWPAPWRTRRSSWASWPGWTSGTRRPRPALVAPGWTIRSSWIGTVCGGRALGWPATSSASTAGWTR